MTDKWDQRFLERARVISLWSKDPSTQVGAVIVNSNRIVCGEGYNGFPRGVKDTLERLNDRAIKYLYTVHAEINALLFGWDLKGSTLYVYPFSPCATCAGAIIQAGIARVVYPKCLDEEVDTERSARWAVHSEAAEAMFMEAGVEVLEIPWG